MRTKISKLGPAFLGLLIVSAAACGGSSGGGTGCDGPCPAEAGKANLDVNQPSIPDATPTADQATAIDQIVAIDVTGTTVDVSPVKLDAGPDASPDTGDVAQDVAAPDLPWGPEVEPKKDAPPPKYDLPVKKDLPPAIDTVGVDGTTLDVTRMDVTPDNTPDLTPEFDTTPDNRKMDADPTLPAVSTDKLIYSVGDNITVTWVNGSTDSSAWVGIYAVGDPDQDWVTELSRPAGYTDDWAYTSGTASAFLSGPTLWVPSTPGTYEVRLFKDVYYVKIATSLPFVVQ